MAQDWVFARGALAREGWETVVDAAVAGWRHTGLRVGDLRAGSLRLEAQGVERIVVPLDGDVRIELEDGSPAASVIELAGRASVFDGPADTAYLGVDAAATLSGSGRVAVAEAPADERIEPQVLRSADCPVELRGAGIASRQVQNFGVPGGLRAQKLIVCEVITPAGNWSSYPPHKHDEDVPGVESQLEEIYWFETAATRGSDASAGADPIGTFAAYGSPGHPIDLAAVVRTGDVALVPWGYHGPAGAAPGYDLYYLNVMAGPGAERVWNITDDPDHAWVRGTWPGTAVDPRLPYPRSIEGDQP